MAENQRQEAQESSEALTTRPCMTSYDPEPTKEGRLVIILIVVFLIVAALFALHIYGVLHSV